jgi:hypothetical protein
METKFSFVINHSNDDKYVLVATAFTVDAENVRNEVKSQTFVNITLAQAFIEQSNFIA